MFYYWMSHQSLGCRKCIVVRTTFSAIFRNSYRCHAGYFLDNVAGWILELDRGEGIPWKETIPLGWTSQAEWHLRKSEA
jgi:hypothetical protein